jgi:phosphoserine phosphatase
MGVADGRYTGVIDYYCYGEEKAKAARQIAAEQGYRLEDCRAYSDSITDLPLLEAVGHPTVVNPDRALRREAVLRGWPVLTFADPVALRLRRPPLRTTLTAAGVGAAAALAAVGWYAWWRPVRS